MKSLTLLLLFFASMAHGQSNIVKVEHWIDYDPGFDMATQDGGFVSQPNVALQINIPAALNIGFHTIGIRSKDANNVWSQTNLFPVYVADSSNGFITTIEYFWNRDNGFGNSGTDTTLVSPVSDLTNGILNVSINLTLHSYDTLYVRSKDSRGRWSQTNYVDTTFYVAGVVSVAELAVETGINVYPNPFVDAITVSPKTNESSRIILSDVSGKLVYDKIINKETKISTQSFSKGAYTLFVWTDKHKIYRATIIKQ